MFGRVVKPQQRPNEVPEAARLCRLPMCRFILRVAWLHRLPAAARRALLPNAPMSGSVSPTAPNSASQSDAVQEPGVEQSGTTGISPTNTRLAPRPAARGTMLVGFLTQSSCSSHKRQEHYTEGCVSQSSSASSHWSRLDRACTSRITLTWESYLWGCERMLAWERLH